MDLGLEVLWSTEKKLLGIPIKGNPFTNDISPEVIKLGHQEIRRFYKNKQKKVDEVKIHLVGDGNSGKTSLVTRLIENTFSLEQKQTNGINIRQKRFKDEDITLKFWDFGGQEKYHSTHNLFFTEKSIFIIIVDGRSESQVEYWLEYVRSLFNDASIILVKNKIDENVNYDVNEFKLKKKYNIEGFFSISCKEGDNVQDLKCNSTTELKDFIIKIAKKNIEKYNISLPNHWFDIRVSLSKENNYISYSRFSEICKLNKIKDIKDRKKLLKFYKNIGDIVSFSHDKQNKIILNPTWLVNAIYKIISNSKYIIELEELEDILDLSYDREDYIFILDTMEEFKRCCIYKEENYLIPSLLSPNPKNEIKDMLEKLSKNKNFLEREFKYKFLSLSIMEEFIVNNIKKLYKDFFWKEGIILEKDKSNSFALIEISLSNKVITLKTWGNEQENFSDDLRKELEKIGTKNYKILIPLDKNNQTYISFKALKGYINNGKDTYFDGELEKSYNVSKLLTGIERENMKDGKTIINIGNLNMENARNTIIGEGTIINNNEKDKINELSHIIEEIQIKLDNYESEEEIKRQALNELKEIRIVLGNTDTSNPKDANKLKEFLLQMKNKSSKTMDFIQSVKDNTELVEWMAEKVPLITALGAGVLG